MSPASTKRSAKPPCHRAKKFKKQMEMSMCHETRATLTKMRNPNSNGRINPFGTDDLTCDLNLSLPERFAAASKLFGFLVKKRLLRSEAEQRHHEIVNVTSST